MTTLRIAYRPEDGVSEREGTCSPVTPAHAALAPRVVVGGRYRLVRVLGAGAMGVVWEAVHLELDRPVAIKVLTARAAREPEMVARFEREARAASRIDHDHVVRVLDFGRLADGSPYLVMPKLEGETLEALLERRGRLALGEVCDLLRPIAAALDAAHALGIVHRDVKPANVIAARTYAGVRLTLVDFGLAALRETGDERLTRAGPVLGTPAYLAPEAAGGDRVDPRADVYALACMAFEMLTGRPPHERDSPMGVLAAKPSEPAPRPSEVTGEPFPEPLEALLARALAIDPRERPESAGAFVRELVRIAEGRARAPERRAAPAAPKRRGTGFSLAAAATIAITIVFALAAASSLAPRASWLEARAIPESAPHASPRSPRAR